VRAAITTDLVKKTNEPCEIWDTKLPGLVLRIRESGTKTYAFFYGRAKKVTLGRASAFTPAEARELARGVIGDIAHGKDPQAERRRKRAGTLRAFVDKHYKPWALENRKSAAKTLERLKQVPDAIMDAPIADLSAWTIERWRMTRRKAGRKDATINRDLDALRSVLSKAKAWKVITEHPMQDVKRAKVDTIGRLRYLSPDEEQRLRARNKTSET
jgi:hypothetical protein